MRLLLWDIDGTLVRAGAVAREVFDRAVEHAVGRSPGDHGVVMGGKTDPQIAREILAAMAIADEHADGHLPAVLARLEEELAAAAQLIRERGTVLPGVAELLERIHGEHGVVQTVLTGNTAANASVKLAAFGLERWLDVALGAFGSDHADRRNLVPIAVDRVRRRVGADPEPVWVIGDTANDLACARAAGARCLLVATGRVPVHELEDLGADAVLPDLGDPARALAVLLG